MNERVRSLFVPLAVALAVIAVAAFMLRAPIERALFLASVRGTTGLSFDVDGVERDGDAYEVTNVRARTAAGALLLSAPSARIGVDGRSLVVALEEPRLVVDLTAMRADLPRPAAQSLDLRVADGTVVIGNGDAAAPVLSFGDIDGTLHLAGGTAPSFSVTADLTDGTEAYPLSGNSTVGEDGTVIDTWNAKRLPIAPLAALAARDGDVRFEGGTLRDVVVSDGAAMNATASLADAVIALGAHVVQKVHGSVVVAGEGIGTPKLEGMLDGTVPIDGAGEVQDLPGRYVWLRDGSNDLGRIARLVEAIAGEPQLRSVHVDTAAPGVAFAQYALATADGPLAISVLSIDPHEPTLHFDTAIAEDHVISGGERTSAMGVRTRAVAGVNGDYFDIGRTYEPQGMLVRSGTLLHGPVDRAALAIDRGNHVTFAEFHLRGTARVGSRSFPVTQFNQWPAGDVTVITPDFGKTLPAADGVTFAALQPLGRDGHTFRVSSVVPVSEPQPVVFGLAFGPNTSSSVRPGEIVHLDYRFDPPLGNAVAAIGGGPILLKDSAWYEDPHAPANGERNYHWPVVALARRPDDDLLLVAVDGRHPERSIGMTRPEFGDLLLRLGAADAMALDSGGSVTMVSRAPGNATVTVRNVPSDSSEERWVSDALFIYSTAPPPSIVPPLLAATPVPEVRPSP